MSKKVALQLTGSEGRSQRTCVYSLTKQRRGGQRSSAATLFDFHVRNHFGVEVALVVQVNYLEVRSLLGHTASRVGSFGLLHYVQVRAGFEFVTLAGTIVGLVKGRRDDPVPTELFEVHGERVQATLRPLLTRFCVAKVLSRAALVTILTEVIHFQFNKWNLKDEICN